MSTDAIGASSGFFFQPHVALLRLAEGYERVGIETGDDVRSIAHSGQVASAQAKHSLIGRNPFADRSVGLWKTLSIWCDAVAEGEVDPKSSKLQLVTNVPVESSLAREISAASDDVDAKRVRERLESIATTLTGAAGDAARHLRTFTPAVVEAVLKAVELVDGKSMAREALFQRIGELLHLPDEVPKENVIEALLGWIDSTCFELWLARQPAWLTRSSFKRRLARTIGRHVDRRILTRTAAAIPISESDRQRYTGRFFLRQIEYLEFNADQASAVMFEALEALLKCISERTRLLEEGYITGEDLADFEDRLVQLWRMRSRVQWRRREPPTNCPPEQCGRDLFEESLQHRESLGGVATEQYYFTQGHFHKLADEPVRIGWHPDYLELRAKS